MKTSASDPFSRNLLALFCAAIVPALLATSANAQTSAFTNATYTFGTNGNVASFAYNGTVIPNLVPGNLVKSADLTSSSSANNFRATGWTTNAAIDTNDYIGFVLSSGAGATLSMSNFNFGIGRSGTGTRAWAWYFSTNGFTNSAILTNYTSLAAGLTNTAGVLSHADENSSWTNNVLNLSGLSGLTNVEFRLYSWSSEASGGTAGLQGPFAFSGAVVGGAPVTAPTITSFSPSSGEVGSTVVITGINLGPSPAVRFNNIAASSSVNPAGTEIIATVPSGASTGPITVEVAGQPVATSSGNFTVVDPLAPTLSTSGTLTAFSTTVGTASASQSFTVSAANIAGSVTVTAPTGFEVSANNITFGPTATLSPVGGVLNNAPAHVRISAAASVGPVSGNIGVSATGVTTQNVAASGIVGGLPTFVSLINTSPNSYTQNFDSLGTTTISNVISAANGVQTGLGSAVSSTLNGWYAAKIGGTGTTVTGIVANNGSSSSGAVYNYGSTNEPANLDRSLGALASGSVVAGFGALIKNDTGQTLQSVQISFTAKFWRSSTTTQNVLTFGYGTVDGATVTTADFLSATNATALAGANIVGPEPVATNGALDGNDPANQSEVSNLDIPVTLAPGATLFIRWQDANESGNDAGLAIDNVSFTAVTSGGPTAYETWAIGFGLNPSLTTGPTAGAPTADPDSDGFNNQQEYSFGTNPTQGTSSLLSTTASGGNLIVRWLERAGVTYNPQSTANLATTAFGPDAEISVVAGPTEPAPPAGYTRKQFSVSAAGNKFYRVRATTP